MKREELFAKKIKDQFGIVIEDKLFYFKGVRVASNEAYKNGVKERVLSSTGFLACDSWLVPSHSFIQTYGHLAKKNIKKLKEQEAKAFARGESIKVNLGLDKKYIIVKYKDYILGLGFYNGKILKSRVPPKKRREIINNIL